VPQVHKDQLVSLESKVTWVQRVQLVRWEPLDLSELQVPKAILDFLDPKDSLVALGQQVFQETLVPQELKEIQVQ